MIKRIVLLCFFTVFTLSLLAISPKKIDRERVDKLMVNRNYSDAITAVGDLLKLYPQDEELNFALGVCLYHTNNDMTRAIAQLEKAHAMTVKRKLLIELRYYLARAYHINMQFDKAIKMYASIKEQLYARNKRQIKEVDALISNCKYAKMMCARPLNVQFTLLDDNINTISDEHTPCLSADERFMVFTSRKKTANDSVAIDGKYFENIYYSVSNGKKWGDPILLSDAFADGHKASVSVSFDGRTMLLYKSNTVISDNSGGDFYISYRTGYKWSKPTKLSENINSLSRETHAALSADGNTIYFSSDRPGGKGNLDIYKSVKTLDGKWGLAINLGDKINTERDEISPYIHADNKTLYYSSNRKLTVGGFDIYSSQLVDDNWTEGVNMGYPINSTRDDVYFNITADGKRAYMASRRVEGQGLFDLYMLDMKDVAPRKIFIVRGNIGDIDRGLSRNGYSLVVRSSDGETRSINPDSVTGDFIFAIDADKSYYVDYSKDGFETMKTILEFPASYYNSINRGVLPLNLISLNKEVGLYQPMNLTADLPACGFIGTDILPEVNGKTGILKILNLCPIKYTIQIMAMRRPLIASYFASFAPDVMSVLGDDGITRYLYKSYSDMDEAQMVMMKMRDLGFWDAFVRELKDGKPGRTLDDSEIEWNNSPVNPKDK